MHFLKWPKYYVILYFLYADYCSLLLNCFINKYVPIQAEFLYFLCFPSRFQLFLLLIQASLYGCTSNL